MNMIGLVGYEVACLRWVVGGMFSKQQVPPPIRERYLYTTDKTAPSAQVSTRPDEHPYESVTREEYNAMSKDEQKAYRDWKSEGAAKIWGACLNVDTTKKAS